MKKLFKRLNRLTTEQLRTLTVLCGGVAVLVVAAVMLSGNIVPEIKLAFKNTDATSLTGNMRWAVQYTGQPSWGDGDFGGAAQGGGDNSDGWPAPRGCRLGSGDGSSSENLCAKDGPAEYRRYAVFSVNEKGNATNGNKSVMTGRATGTRTGIREWDASWERSVGANDGQNITINTDSNINVEWICQDSQVNYYQDECGLGGVKWCTSTYNGRIDQNAVKSVRLFTGVETQGFSASSISGNREITPPYGTTEYRVRCTSGSGNGPWMSLRVTRPLPPAPPPPTSSSLASSCGAGGTSVTLSWGTSAGATGYYPRIDPVYVACPSGWLKTGNTCYRDNYGATSVTFPTTPGQTYTWWVHAGGTGGVGSASASSFMCAGPAAGANLIPNGNTTATDDQSVVQGNPVTFTWATSNVSSCSIAKASAAPWNPATTATSITGIAVNNNTGVAVTYPTVGTYTYTLNCVSNNGSANPSDSVLVNVTTAPTPTASISAAANAVTSGGSTSLSWACTNSVSGSVANNRNATVWSGLNSSGQSTGALTQNTTYTLTCTNSAGVTAQDTQLVEVCTASQHIEGGSCVSNTRTCTPLNAPANSGTQTWNGTAWGACIADSGATPQGVCNEGYHVEGGACVVDEPQLTVFLASPIRVQQGTDTTLTWVGTELPDTCQLTSSPAINDPDGSNDSPRDVSSTWTGNSPSNGTGTGAAVGPIMQTTIFTLNCGSGQAQKTVTVVPNVTEI